MGRGAKENSSKAAAAAGRRLQTSSILISTSCCKIEGAEERESGVKMYHGLWSNHQIAWPNGSGVELGNQVEKLMPAPMMPSCMRRLHPDAVQDSNIPIFQY